MGENIEFSRYLGEEGYEIISVTAEEQLQYACNVVNLGKSRILSCHAPTARKIAGPLTSTERSSTWTILPSSPCMEHCTAALRLLNEFDGFFLGLQILHSKK